MKAGSERLAELQKLSKKELLKSAKNLPGVSVSPMANISG